MLVKAGAQQVGRAGDVVAYSAIEVKEWIGDAGRGQVDHTIGPGFTDCAAGLLQVAQISKDAACHGVQSCQRRGQQCIRAIRGANQQRDFHILATVHQQRDESTADETSSPGD